MLLDAPLCLFNLLFLLFADVSEAVNVTDLSYESELKLKESLTGERSCFFFSTRRVDTSIAPRRDTHTTKCWNKMSSVKAGNFIPSTI